MSDPVTGAPAEPFRIEAGTEFGARVVRHLREDRVLWLTTVGPSGAPSPNPVWFLWDGAASVRIYSLPDAARVRHMRANPGVSLNFPGDARGGDVVVLTGTAQLRPGDPRADADPDYLAKYSDDIGRIGLTTPRFAQRYSLPVVVSLTRVRGH
jgi:PPOX class probable F420-dependent enzyme